MDDGRTCVLLGSGVRDHQGVEPVRGAVPAEIVSYMLPEVVGQCTFPGDWESRGPEALRALLLHAARHVLSGQVPPFDGPRGPQVRDLVIRAATMPAARLRALAAADAPLHRARAVVTALLVGDPRRAHAVARLPRYLEHAASVVLAREDHDGRAQLTPREVADAVLSAATALVACDRPGLHTHTRAAVAYRALVAPFVQ
ncbi:hypothetical protein PYV61_00355 [Roseisolibacter sp. H3M3-2]|nr:hypothetical protein [Roseisolibacter sp. H3M3-2]